MSDSAEKGIMCLFMVCINIWCLLHISCNFKGSILSCDLAFACLHGYHNPEELKGVSVKELIPSLQIPVYSHALPKVSVRCNLPHDISLFWNFFEKFQNLVGVHQIFLALASHYSNYDCILFLSFRCWGFRRCVGEAQEVHLSRSMWNFRGQRCVGNPNTTTTMAAPCQDTAPISFLLWTTWVFQIIGTSKKL